MTAWWWWWWWFVVYSRMDTLPLLRSEDNPLLGLLLPPSLPSGATCCCRTGQCPSDRPFACAGGIRLALASRRHATPPLSREAARAARRPRSPRSGGPPASMISSRRPPHKLLLATPGRLGRRREVEGRAWRTTRAQSVPIRCTVSAVGAVAEGRTWWSYSKAAVTRWRRSRLCIAMREEGRESAA